jgi:hypothetical protein
MWCCLRLTDDGYEMLALTMAELRNFIAQQRAITAALS